MADYKRFVSYIYNYEFNTKKNNVGYVRVESKNGQCKITVHIKVLTMNEHRIPIYFFHRNKETYECIWIGTMVPRNGVGEFQALTETANIMKTGYSLDDMGGMILYASEEKFFGTEWDDIPICLHEFQVVEEKGKIGKSEKNKVSQQISSNQQVKAQQQKSPLYAEIESKRSDINKDENQRISAAELAISATEKQKNKNADVVRIGNYNESNSNIKLNSNIKSNNNIESDYNIKSDNNIESDQIIKIEKAIPLSNLELFHGQKKQENESRLGQKRENLEEIKGRIEGVKTKIQEGAKNKVLSIEEETRRRAETFKELNNMFKQIKMATAKKDTSLLEPEKSIHEASGQSILSEQVKPINESSSASNQINFIKEESKLTNQTEKSKELSNISSQAEVEKELSNVSSQAEIAKELSNVSSQAEVARELSNLPNQAEIEKGLSSLSGQAKVQKDTSNVINQIESIKEKFDLPNATSINKIPSVNGEDTSTEQDFLKQWTNLISNKTEEVVSTNLKKEEEKEIEKEANAALQQEYTYELEENKGNDLNSMLSSKKETTLSDVIAGIAREAMFGKQEDEQNKTTLQEFIKEREIEVSKTEEKQSLNNLSEKFDTSIPNEMAMAQEAAENIEMDAVTEREKIKESAKAAKVIQMKTQSKEEDRIMKMFIQYPKIYPFEDDEILECVRIEPQDIGVFPMAVWNLANNSFLLHGYYSYRHLIFAKQKKNGKIRYIVGIPGIYQNREKFMAQMFGFHDFKTVKRKEQKTGEFGYWLTPIKIQ